MFCCFRPSANEQDEQKLSAGHAPTPAEQVHTSPSHESLVQPAATAKAVPPRRSASISAQPGTIQQQSSGAVPAVNQQHLEPLAKVGEGAAMQAAPISSPDTGAVNTAANTAADDMQGQQGGVLKLVALLQELLALSTASPRQPLSKAMGLLVVRLPVDWACLHAISSSGQVVLQVRAVQSTAEE